MEDAHPFTDLIGGGDPQVKEMDSHTSLRRGEHLAMEENDSPSVL